MGLVTLVPSLLQSMAFPLPLRSELKVPMGEESEPVPSNAIMKNPDTYTIPRITHLTPSILKIEIFTFEFIAVVF